MYAHIYAHMVLSVCVSSMTMQLDFQFSLIRAEANGGPGGEAEHLSENFVLLSEFL